MKALKIIGIILLIVIVLLLVIAIFLPKKASVEGNIIVKAPAEAVFEQVNTMSNWEKWSPFKEEDPEMIVFYEGVGVEAVQTWIEEGDTGMLTIIESKPYEKILTDIQWDDMSKANGYWTFEPMGDSTKITWKVEIKDLAYPIERYMGLFFGGMMDPYIQKGLKNIKKHVEALPPIPEIEEVYVDEIHALAIKDTVQMKDMEMKMGEFFGELMGYLSQNNINIEHPPFTLYYSWDENSAYLAAGIQTKELHEGRGKIVPITFGNTNALKAVHMGSYDGLMIVYAALEDYAEENNKTWAGAPWEEYLTDPMTEKDTSKWKTVVYWPVE